MTIDDVIMALEWLDVLKKDPNNPEYLLIQCDMEKLRKEVAAEDAKNFLRANKDFLRWNPYVPL